MTTPPNNTPSTSNNSYETLPAPSISGTNVSQPLPRVSNPQTGSGAFLGAGDGAGAAREVAHVLAGLNLSAVTHSQPQPGTHPHRGFRLPPTHPINHRRTAFVATVIDALNDPDFDLELNRECLHTHLEDLPEAATRWMVHGRTRTESEDLAFAFFVHLLYYVVERAPLPYNVL